MSCVGRGTLKSDMLAPVSKMFNEEPIAGWLTTNAFATFWCGDNDVTLYRPQSAQVKQTVGLGLMTNIINLT